MVDERFREIVSNYAQLSVAVVGDYCLDRYLEIDPSIAEVSIETGLEVHNVTNVRAQPGGCGTILNNLVALGCGNLLPVGFAGCDGEGYELINALSVSKTIDLKYFFQTTERRTFTYCKPLILSDGVLPRELNRLDSKNWTKTPQSVQDNLISAIYSLANEVDAIVLLEQVDCPESGVLCGKVLDAISQVRADRPDLLILADSRRGFDHFPSVGFKMNRSEFQSLIGVSGDLPMDELKIEVARLADLRRQIVFVSLSEDGIVGAIPGESAAHVPILPLTGEIDVVGAGDTVMANLIMALASNASVSESMRIAMAAASIVVKQLGTTGVATQNDISAILNDFNSTD